MAKKKAVKKQRKTTAKSSKPTKARSKLPRPLVSKEIFRECPLTRFSFQNTKNKKTSHDFIAQDRAIKAINIGLGIRKPGYNIYVAGYSGTGKTSVIRSFLEKMSKDAETPGDWIYVHNFDHPESPKAIALNAGEGRKLKKRMDTLVKDLREEIPKALQSEDYENTINTYLGSSNERKSKLFSELEKLAKSLDFTIKSTRMGIETVPVVDGRILNEKEYNKLDEPQRDDIEARRARLEPEVLDFARKVRTIDREAREYIENLRSEMGNQLVSSIMEPLFEDYTEPAEIAEYLEAVKNDILENILDFDEEDDAGEEEVQHVHIPDDRDQFVKYSINVFIDHTKAKGAPVVIETNPTYYNLFGKIEKNVEHGMYLTDLTMIKPGAIQRANGGYLVMHILDIFKNPQIWETLKRVLRNRQAFIEDMGEQYAVLPTSGLRPEPIPLEIKVILIGNDEVYHYLIEEDEEFQKIFKVKADFDFKMERTQRNINSYVTFVATRINREGLLPFDKSGVAAIVEHGSRMVEDQTLLSTQFSEVKDLTIEADYAARQSGARLIKRSHVEEALDEKFYRLNLVEEHLLEMIKTEDVMLSVTGSRIGQINGLTVYDMGDISFGKAARITCTTSISDDGIINVERASRLSGKLHDKGMHILAGYLNGILGRKRSLGISASVCFEQSYGYIDGDSASTAELIAIISSMAEIPIKQNFAITGSINQLGDIQPIGGVNEKIEGFYKICQMMGKRQKNFGLVIPKQNVANLMLHRDVRAAVKSGELSIYPVGQLWEAFELLTDVPLGVKDYHDGKFSEGSALSIIQDKLDDLYEEENSEADEHPAHKKDPHKIKKAAASRSAP